MDVSGHAAIVTGAASGLGAATARALAAAGARVALLDLNAGDAGTLADEIGGLAINCDVSRLQQANIRQRAFAGLEEGFDL